MKIEAVDLFCGAGGLSLGLHKAGIKVKAGVDFELACEFPFEANIPKARFIHSDISLLSSEDVIQRYASNSIRLLAGCAPCQPFSTLSNGTDRKKNDKWPLLRHFGRLVEETKPQLVTMENVPVLMSQEIFKEFVRFLERNKYRVWHEIVDASEYGVPQRRKRLVLMASQYGDVKLLSPSELKIQRKTVREAIGGLPQIKAGETCRTDRLHRARNLTEINLKRLRVSKPGGTWRDWPKSLLSPCHTKESGQSFSSVYSRMEWDKPSPTITTQSTNFGTGRFGHPEQDRSLTLREMAILQSFPLDYQFEAPDSKLGFSNIGKLIGNAVPVDLGYAIGKTFKDHLKSIGVGNE